MGYNLPKRAKTDIIALARRCGLTKVILVGSRARGDNWERSDIDLAVSGGDTANFILSIDDEIRSLLMFDIVDLDKPAQTELLAEIERDGVIIYEEV